MKELLRRIAQTLVDQPEKVQISDLNRSQKKSPFICPGHHMAHHLGWFYSMLSPGRHAWIFSAKSLISPLSGWPTAAGASSIHGGGGSFFAPFPNVRD